jgi:hypothetical protein
MAGKNFHITSETCVRIATALFKIAKFREPLLGFPEAKGLKSCSLRSTFSRRVYTSSFLNYGNYDSGKRIWVVSGKTHVLSFGLLKC